MAIFSMSSVFCSSLRSSPDPTKVVVLATGFQMWPKVLVMSMLSILALCQDSYSLVTIFTTSPSQIRFPIQFSAAFNGTRTWQFRWMFEGYIEPCRNINSYALSDKPGLKDQSCTISGRASQTPCSSSVMEKTWLAPGSWSVKVAVSSSAGILLAEGSVIVLVTSEITTPAVVRKEIRSTTPAEWQQFVNALYTLKLNGIYDHFVYIHKVGPSKHCVCMWCIVLCCACAIALYECL